MTSYDELMGSEQRVQADHQATEHHDGTVLSANYPIRSSKSLNKAINDAEGDEDLLRIQKNLDRRGISTTTIPALRPGSLESKY